MTDLEKYDTNGNGVIDPEELAVIELEDRRRRMEDEDAQRDQQRRMVWFALFGMLLYPVAIMVADFLGLENAANILGSIASIYFVSVAGIVGVFFGVTNIKK